MGRPIVHWEFWSEKPERVSEFYKKVFDWEIRFMPEMNYHMVETGGAGGINGGITKPDVPSSAKAALYIDVDDIAAYAKRVTSAGGKILADQIDIPGVGQFALFEDPDGRVLGMWKKQQ